MSEAVLKYNMSERTPPKFYNASEDFDCTFVCFFNSHSKYYNALLQEVLLASVKAKPSSEGVSQLRLVLGYNACL